MDTYGDTTATSPDPLLGSEGDTNQLELDDTLLDRGAPPAEEGYTVPERPLSYTRLETDLEQSLGETLDQKLRREEPDIFEEPPVSDPLRSGRLEVEDSDIDGLSSNSVFARDAGISGGAASAEEAAMHVEE